jgi:tRNA1(Val) A37 N6-methylase TrmN6
MPDSLKADETLDVFCNGKVRLIQKKKGYRLSIDPFLLANFVDLKKGETLLDIGAGCGIIPVYLSGKGFASRLVGIEVQEELYELSLRNKALNVCANVEFLKGDVRTAGIRPGSFDVIVSNPPYVKAGTGRTSPGLSRLIARHESALDLPALLAAAASLLSTHGRLCLVYPARRLAELIGAAQSAGLEPKRLRPVYSRQGEAAVLSLAECMKGAGTGVSVERPLYIYENDDYTEEVKRYYA